MMKRVLLFLFVSLYSLINVNAVVKEIKMVDGSVFYYSTYYTKGTSQHEMDYISAQTIHVEDTRILIPGLEEEIEKEIKRDVEAKFKLQIKQLYRANHERMKKYHDYSFDELYDMVYKHFTSGTVMIWHTDETMTDEDISYHLTVRVNIILSNQRWKIEKYPYVLGYLYKDVKYYDGKIIELDKK